MDEETFQGAVRELVLLHPQMQALQHLRLFLPAQLSNQPQRRLQGLMRLVEALQPAEQPLQAAWCLAACRGELSPADGRFHPMQLHVVIPSQGGEGGQELALDVEEDTEAGGSVALTGDVAL